MVEKACAFDAAQRRASFCNKSAAAPPLTVPSEKARVRISGEIGTRDGGSDGARSA